MLEAIVKVIFWKWFLDVRIICKGKTLEAVLDDGSICLGKTLEVVSRC
jgi:hypothetical protein